MQRLRAFWPLLSLKNSDKWMFCVAPRKVSGVFSKREFLFEAALHFIFLPLAKLIIPGFTAAYQGGERCNEY
jgi:hypothetical protein